MHLLLHLSMHLSMLPDRAIAWANRLSERQLFWLVMGLTALVIFWGLGLRSPWPADEPRFAEIAREMVDSGQWLIPRRGGEFYPDKPPVFMWTIALFYKITGNLRVAFLLPSALCALITAALVFDLGRRFRNAQTGALAVILLLFAPQFLIQAKSAQIDAMIACWVTVGCYGLSRHFFERPNWGLYFTAWGFMGLGIITKGVGFLPLLMLIPIGLLALNKRHDFGPSLSWRCAAGPLVMLLVVAAWIVPMLMHVDQLDTAAAYAYRDNILLKQTAERYTDTWTHLNPWHYFVSNVIPVLWFPLPLIAIARWRELAENLKTRPLLMTWFVWVVLVILFFSASPGKRGVYILPALPVFALVLATAVSDWRSVRWLSIALTAVHLLLAVTLAAVMIMVWLDHPLLMDRLSDYNNDPDNLSLITAFIFSVALTWIASLILFWRSAADARLFVALMISFVLYSSLGYMALEPIRTPRDVLANTEEFLPVDSQLGLIAFKEQFILFSRLDVTHFSYLADPAEQERNAWRWQEEGSNRYLLVPDNLELTCFRADSAPVMGVAHRARWLILGREQRLAGCEAAIQRQQFTTQSPGRWLR